MIIITSEFIYYNIKLDESCDIVENTRLKDEQKVTVGCRGMVKVECIVDFLDKIKNEINFMKTRSFNIIEELNKILQSGKGMVKFVRPDKLRNKIERF